MWSDIKEDIFETGVGWRDFEVQKEEPAIWFSLDYNFLYLRVLEVILLDQGIRV